MKEYFDKVKGDMEAEQEINTRNFMYYEGYIQALFSVGFLSLDETMELTDYSSDLWNRYLQS